MTPRSPATSPAAIRRAIRRYGCGTCYELPGVGGATSHVGPSLGTLGSRLYLAAFLYTLR